ncbi:MAG: mucoidy inhibitor MuiA family protein [Chloroflexi bacterium]|nr:mucoidy inhibitor MuiA family protein [Chloroflexota bacterium]
MELDTRITAVTVYRNRARVARSGEVELDAGEMTLVLSGLPNVVDPDSVRVSGKGAGITIRGVDVKSDVQSDTSSKKDLQDEFDSLRRQEKAIEHEHRALEEKIEYFKALKVQTSEESGHALLKEETSFERVTAIADYIQQQLNRAFEQQRTVSYEWDEVKRQLEAHQIRLLDNDPQKVQAGRAVHVAVEAEAAMTFSFVIEYLVNKASWKPLYDVRLVEDNSVELTYMAQITQETGEDWDEVDLALSTARPALQSQLPKLEAWYVDDDALRQRLAAYGPAMDMMEMPMAAKRSSPIVNAAAGAVGAAVGVVGAAVEAIRPQEQVVDIAQAAISTTTSGAVITYTVGTPVTIPGSGEPHKTTITTTGLEAELDYLTTPRLALEAYLRATITNTSLYTLLPGEASIYHENDFVGKSQLETITPNDEFKVQLGVDDRIKVERELVNREAGTRRIGTRAETSFDYEIKLTNLLGKEAKLIVQDQYPVSKSSSIKVKLDRARPEPAEESDLHVLTWEFELEPQEVKTIHLAFTVEYPRHQRVWGLDD